MGDTFIWLPLNGILISLTEYCLTIELLYCDFWTSVYLYQNDNNIESVALCMNTNLYGRQYKKGLSLPRLTL